MPKEGYEQLQDTMKKWYAAKGINDYFLDGPVTDKYWSEPFKVAVLNLEAYGYKGCHEVIIDSALIEKWMKATGGKNANGDNVSTKTTRYTSVFIHALFESFQTKIVHNANSIRKLYSNFDDLLKSMEQISYLNIRKISNDKPPQDIASINEESNGKWRTFLRLQFEELKPDLVIIGGAVGCSAANRIFDLDGKLKYKCSYNLDNGLKMQSVKHFSRPNYSEMAEAVNNCMSIVGYRQ